MNSSRVTTYLAIVLSFIPFTLEYFIANQIADFAVLDGFSLSLFLFSFLILLTLKSIRLMLITGISTAFLSFIFIKINLEYYAMFNVYISYDVLPLFQDMYRAMVHFDLTPVYIALFSYFFICVIILFFIKSSILPKHNFKTAFILIVISLVLSTFTSSTHSTRYDLIPQEQANGHNSINFSFENSIMFFLRSLPIVYLFSNEQLEETKSFKTVASAIANKTPITLPQQFTLQNYSQLIPNYPGYHLDKTKHLTFKHKPIIGAKTTQSNKNIILITLESIRAYETGIDNPKNSVTPNLDFIAKHGLSASRAFSTNRVTVKSELSMLCSRPDTQDGIPFSIYKAEVQMDCLPKILKKHGYQTFWFHGNTKEFFNRGQFLPSLGFQHIYDKESFLKDGHTYEDLGWGIDDHDFFDHVLHKLENEEKPFFAELLTLSNHQPFNWDFKGFSFPEHLNYKSKDIYKNYLRSIYYSDHALGEFYKAFNNSKLKDNTILIITGDHGVPFFPSSLKKETERFKTIFQTPLIVIDNSIKPKTIDTQLSHYDIAPTVLSLLNIQEDNMFIGRPFLGHNKTLKDRPIYLDNMNNFGFLMGGLACLPTKDHCDLSNAQCVKFEDKLCSVDSTEQLNVINEINPFKNYLSLLLEAGLL